MLRFILTLLLLVSLAAPSSAQPPEAGPAGPITLHQNYPNPFEAETLLTYELDDAAHVTLSVYDMLGGKVLDLVDARQQAGTHHTTWDGRDARGRPAQAGMYLYRLEAGDATATRTMVLLR